MQIYFLPFGHYIGILFEYQGKKCSYVEHDVSLNLLKMKKQFL